MYDLASEVARDTSARLTRLRALDNWKLLVAVVAVQVSRMLALVLSSLGLLNPQEACSVCSLLMLVTVILTFRVFCVASTSEHETEEMMERPKRESARLIVPWVSTLAGSGGGGGGGGGGVALAIDIIWDLSGGAASSDSLAPSTGGTTKKGDPCLGRYHSQVGAGAYLFSKLDHPDLGNLCRVDESITN